jgi:hypothetical protein
MTVGAAIGSRAIGDGGRRDQPSEWGGPDPSAARAGARVSRRGLDDRRIVPRKP